MEINPIREIRPAALGIPQTEGDVHAPLALSGTSRMEDDAYRDGDGAPRRGLEEEEPEGDVEESDDQGAQFDQVSAGSEDSGSEHRLINFVA
jgi:hypothetical protein